MATVTPPRQPPVFNLPNYLTAARMVLGFVLFGLIAYHLWTACILVFAAAAFTDWLDGYAARKMGLSSSLGRNFDPLVDKVVICGAYIFLVEVAGSGVAAWMVMVVVVRELIITSLRSYLENASVTFGADWLGKIKMGLQCAALFAIFVAMQYDGPYLFAARDGLIYGMLIATALSGIQYLWRALALLRADM